MMPRQFTPDGGETDLFSELGRTPAVSAVASAVC